MGSIARVKVYYEDLQPLLSENNDRQDKVKVYAAALNGNDIRNVTPVKEGIIIIGNESKGIRDGLLQLADEKITILKRGKAESLNAAVATGVILSHLVR